MRMFKRVTAAALLAAMAATMLTGCWLDEQTGAEAASSKAAIIAAADTEAINENKTLKEQLASLNEQKQKLTEELEEAKNSSASNAEDAAAKAKKITELEDDIKGLEAKIAKKQDELDKANSDLAIAQKALEDAGKLTDEVSIVDVNKTAFSEKVKGKIASISSLSDNTFEYNSQLDALANANATSTLYDEYGARDESKMNAYGLAVTAKKEEVITSSNGYDTSSFYGQGAICILNAGITEERAIDAMLRLISTYSFYFTDGANYEYGLGVAECDGMYEACIVFAKKAETAS